MNAYLGQSVTTGSGMVAFLRAHNPEQEGVEWSEHGNFTDGALTEYLACHNASDEHIMFVNVVVSGEFQHVEGTCSKAMFLSHFPPAVSNILYNFRMPTGGVHFACIKKHEATNQWYFLDSMIGFQPHSNRGDAIVMNDNDWQYLDGSYMVGGRYNPVTNGLMGYCPPDLLRHELDFDDSSRIVLADINLLRFSAVALRCRIDRTPAARRAARATRATRAPFVPYADAMYLSSGDDDEPSNPTQHGGKNLSWGGPTGGASIEYANNVPCV